MAQYLEIVGHGNYKVSKCERLLYSQIRFPFFYTTLSFYFNGIIYRGWEKKNKTLNKILSVLSPF